MRSFHDLTGTALDWTKRAGRTYDLKYGEETFATLEWAGAFGSLATGRTAEASFSFKRAGFLQPAVRVRRAGSESDVATLRMSFGGDGTLFVEDGKRFDFRRQGFWSPEWSFDDVTGRRVCRFTLTAQFLRRESRVTLDVFPRSEPHLPLLVVLGWYTILLQMDEAAGAAVVAGAIAPLG